MDWVYRWIIVLWKWLFGGKPDPPSETPGKPTIDMAEG